MTEKDSKRQSDLSARILRFFVVGVLLTLIDYIIYQVALEILFGGDNKMIWLATIISGVIATVIAYFMHKNITWKRKTVNKSHIVRFFVWNAIMALMLRPLIANFFGLFGGLYQLGTGILNWMGIGCTYDFVERNAIYVLMIAVAMTLNYLVYDRFVFGKRAEEK